MSANKRNETKYYMKKCVFHTYCNISDEQQSRENKKCQEHFIACRNHDKNPESVHKYIHEKIAFHT
jgi:hypothetical protein